MDYRDVTLAGVIPGGQSFQIPVSPGASSVTWLPQVVPGTSIFILAGDSRGTASGGSSSTRAVWDGPRTCLSGGLYSSTFVGEVPTISPPHTSISPPYTSAISPPDKSSGNGGGIKSPLVIGITAGLLPLFALVSVLLYLRYRKRHRHNKVDLWDDNDSHEPVNVLEPTPFPPHPHRGSGRGSFDSNGHRYSSSAFQSGPPQTPISYTSSPYHDLPQAPAGFSMINPDGGGPVVGGSWWRESRKQPPPRARPVTFLQHQDAGTVEPTVHEEAELVELPPSYADVGKSLMGSPPPAPPK